MTTKSSTRFPLAWLVAGFALWSVTFLALYMVLTLGCAYGWTSIETISGMSLHRLVLAAIALAAVIAGAALSWCFHLSDHAGQNVTLGRIVHGLNATSLISLVATVAPVARLSICH